MDITVNITSPSTNRGLNKYDLLQSESKEVVTQYEEVLEPVKGSLTTVTDNDVTSKFTVSISTLNPTQDQVETLELVKLHFKAIENQIDPNRLFFKIDKTIDDEFCIYRKSNDGISNLIINDDGSLSFSFIAYKQSDQTDSYVFYEKGGITDYELLAFNFFAL